MIDRSGGAGFPLGARERMRELLERKLNGFSERECYCGLENMGILRRKG